jgi:hypothetical protein
MNRVEAVRAAQRGHRLAKHSATFPRPVAHPDSEGRLGCLRLVANGEILFRDQLGGVGSRRIKYVASSRTRGDHRGACPFSAEESPTGLIAA